MTHGLLGAVAPGFDRPLDVLEACHGRIAKQCDTLEKMLAHLPAHGADVQAQQAARAVLAYFDTAAVHHHDDEELGPRVPRPAPPWRARPAPAIWSKP